MSSIIPNSRSPFAPSFTTPQQLARAYEMELRAKYAALREEWNLKQERLRYLFFILHEITPPNRISLAQFLAMRHTVPVADYEEEAIIGVEIIREYAAIEARLPAMMKERGRLQTQINVMEIGQHRDQAWEGWYEAAEKVKKLEARVGAQLEPESNRIQAQKATPLVAHNEVGIAPPKKNSASLPGRPNCMDMKSLLTPMTPPDTPMKTAVSAPEKQKFSSGLVMGIYQSNHSSGNSGASSAASPDNYASGTPGGQASALDPIPFALLYASLREYKEKSTPRVKPGNIVNEPTTWEEFLEVEARPLEMHEPTIWEIQRELAELREFAEECQLQVLLGGAPQELQ